MQPDHSQAPPRPAPRALKRLPIWAYLLALLAIASALTTSGMLAWSHLTGGSLPGCGVPAQPLGTQLTAAEPKKPACATLDAHPMGSLGGMLTYIKSQLAHTPVHAITPDQALWPMSLLGASYFAALLAAWLAVGFNHRSLSPALRAVVRLGALASVAYCVALALEYLHVHDFCKYCLATHLANFTLLILMELGMYKSRSVSLTPARPGRFAQIATAAVAFALVATALGAADFHRRAEVRKHSAAEAEVSTSKIIKKIQEQKAAPHGQQADQAPPPWGADGFQGRWLLGPKKAKVRIVMLSDYQCPDCKRNESEAVALLGKYKDQVSLSVFHFPLCADCNSYAKTTMHANACWAARAAEAAGILKGPDGFWAMHKWLFEHSGAFTQPDLEAGLKELGYDPNVFIAVMQSDGTLQAVKKDTAVGEALGLYFTPMIFINGVEFRGWQTPGALTHVVEAAMQADPPAETAQADHPPLAREKYIGDWRVSPTVALPAPRPGQELGKPDAKVEVVVFGDYSEPNTQLVNDQLVKLVNDGKPMNYTFIAYPTDKDCNPTLPKTFFLNGCLAAKAAQAAANLGGENAYWSMHAKLFQNRDRMTMTTILACAAQLGLDTTKFEAEMNSPAVQSIIQQNITAAQQAGLTAVPAVYINHKLVVRWLLEGDNIIERIIDEAAQAPGAAQSTAKEVK